MNLDLQIVDEFEQRFGESAAHSRAQHFMLAYLSLMSQPLPEVAARNLDIARQFLNGSLLRESLFEARVSCWKYLDLRKASTDITKPEYCAIRAVICLLDDRPGDGGDAVDLIDFFLDVANKFEDQSENADRLLRQSFPGVQE